MDIEDIMRKVLKDDIEVLSKIYETDSEELTQLLLDSADPNNDMTEDFYNHKTKVLLDDMKDVVLRLNSLKDTFKYYGGKDDV